METCEWAAIIAALVFAGALLTYWEAHVVNRDTRRRLAELQYDIERGLER